MYLVSLSYAGMSWGHCQLEENLKKRLFTDGELKGTEKHREEPKGHRGGALNPQASKGKGKRAVAEPNEAAAMAESLLDGSQAAGLGHRQRINVSLTLTLILLICCWCHPLTNIIRSQRSR